MDSFQFLAVLLPTPPHPAKALGGDLSSQNLVPACSWCNLFKNARLAPMNPPGGYVGEWPPSFWPLRIRSWWYRIYGMGCGKDCNTPEPDLPPHAELLGRIAR